MWTRATRDASIVIVALILAVFEVIIGGGRPAVLTFLAALLASPLAMRADEIWRQRDKASEIKNDRTD